MLNSLTASIVGLTLAGSVFSAQLGLYDDVMQQFQLVETIMEEGFEEALRVAPFE